MSLTKGLVGHWTMDDRDVVGTTVRDRSGHGHHATLVNGVETGAPSPIGQACSLPAADDRISAPLNTVGFEDFSISVWGYWDDLTGPGSNLGHSVFRADNPHSFQFAVYGGDGLIRTYTHTNQGGTGSGYGLKLGGSPGTWHHICLVREEMDLRGYRDGALRDSRTLNVGDDGWLLNTTSVMWGVGSGAEQFFGDISETRFYNRALTDAEVSALAAQQTPRLAYV